MVGFSLDLFDVVIDVVAAGVLAAATVSGVGVRGALIGISGTRVVKDVSDVVGGDCGIERLRHR